ncbi:hypothetical protein [Mycolicibacter kumamotonensis]|uniref:Uncharacterized protein n=1 Tax=Mycolicibacter kumamotonensis TaxID=354243 RepID=A0A1B8SL70_9MYCO|nr:hypothetical protein [Mycolicibacter kumamotonensis]OBY33457.1 hypothetical protein ACT18_00455 [Mycolicibacter kumamotonensis]
MSKADIPAADIFVMPRFVRGAAPRVSRDRKLWSLDHQLNAEVTAKLRENDRFASLHWGEFSAIENGSVQVGDLVYTHNSRQSSFRSANWERHAVNTLREVGSVITDDRGTLRIRVRKVGGKGKGGQVHWGSADFTVADKLEEVR